MLLKNVIYRLRKKIEPDPTQPRYLLTESTLGYKFQPDGDPPARSNPHSENHLPVKTDKANNRDDRPARTIQSSSLEKQTYPVGRMKVKLPEFNVRHTSQLRPEMLLNPK